tara:strand:+ start:907 stop:1629 length:723 start_codon:yes stop_codon:yes gene_type:complete
MKKIIIIFVTISTIFSQDLGKKMIENEDFTSALIYYKKLLKENNNLPKEDILFNIASIYSLLDSTEVAEKYFNLSNQDSIISTADLNYNHGNLLYRNKRLTESLSLFKEALLKNPEDKDARINYEIVKNEIENNKTSQEDENSKKDKEESDNKKEKNKDDSDKKKNKDDKSNNSKNDPQVNDQNDGPKDNNQDNKTDKNENKQIRNDQSSENILNALKENEKVNKKRKQKRYSNTSGKQW